MNLGDELEDDGTPPDAQMTRERGARYDPGSLDAAVPAKARIAMTMPCRLRSFLAGSAAWVLLSAPVHAADLRIVVEEIGSQSGTLVVGLYDTPEGYRQAVRESSKILVNEPKRLAGLSLRPAGRTVTAVFADLAPGLYAVIVVHDENDDGQFNKGLLGVPAEPYGISNNPRTLMTPPDFAQAAVRVGERDEASGSRSSLQATVSAARPCADVVAVQAAAGIHAKPSRTCISCRLLAIALPGHPRLRLHAA
jgi:uncharacterized protein (DUF2141 family)